MAYVPQQMPPRDWHATEIVAQVLSAGVLILAGIITVVQFAYY